MQVQEEMLKVHWREDVLALPQCQAQVGGRNQGLIFQGPRIKMGIYEGTRTRVAPHTTTGSTDYFGPLVNGELPQPVAVPKKTLLQQK
ncbi:hypothetical protein ABBQ38_006269 [Trebouxia sp. C0009 RCD-2024]